MTKLPLRYVNEYRDVRRESQALFQATGTEADSVTWASGL